MVTGREAILARSEQLEELARRCGQHGAMHGLGLLLGSRFAARKRPYLIGFTDESAAEKGAPDALFCAVLLLEYRAGAFGTGLFATADAFGVRTVIAPEHLRASTAVVAVRLMLDRGARIILTTFKSEVPFHVAPHPASRREGGYLYAVQRRTVQDTLPLRDTLDATLGTLGKRTRVHMRAARRRWEKDFPGAFLDDALPALASYDAEAMRQLNETCLDPIDQDDFDHQVRSVRGRGSFALGLRNGDRWLAMVAGWRQGDAAWVEWQINSSGYEKLSLGSVLRTYLLEHEAALGVRQVGFHGGTSHSMVHSFVHEDVYDLLGRRPGLLTRLIVMLARTVYARFPVLQRRGNFLLDALAAPQITWSDHPEHSPVDSCCW